MVLRKSFYIRWSAGRSPRVHEVNPGRDPSLLKGYKFDVGKIIESSIRCFHKNVKRGLIPHPATITRICILAGVKGTWAEEETCPKVSSLTLTGVIKGPKSIKMKEMEIVEVAEELEEEENEQLRMEQISYEGQL